MSKMKTTYFSNVWLIDPKYSLWLTKAGDATKATCKLCKKDFSLSNMGKKSLNSHAQGENHKKRVKPKNVFRVMEYVKNILKRPCIANLIVLFILFVPNSFICHRSC